MKLINLVFLCFFFFSQHRLSEAATRAEILLEKSQEAKNLLNEVELSIETKSEKRVCKKKVLSKKTRKLVWISYACGFEFVAYKEIALAAWDSITDKMHVVRIMVPFLPPPSFPFRVLTEGFDVEYISGRGHSKLIVEVRADGRKFLVLAGKHWWVPPQYFRNDNPKVFEKYAEEIVYSPYTPDLYDEEMILIGAKFLFEEITAAKLELRASGAMSKALPEQLLSEAIPDDYIFNLGHNEQMDHAKFDADPNLTAEEVSIEYALNKSNAFRWVASIANARGAFQFTNISFGKNLGTYDAVVRACQEARLITDFNFGTQDLRNMIKAAICLLDMELARFPKDALELFVKDYRAASVYPSACYNGGCGKGFRLYNWIRANKKELRADAFNYPVSAVGHRETHKYLEKQSFLWSYVDGIKEKLKNYKKEQL